MKQEAKIMTNPIGMIPGGSTLSAMR